MNNSSSKNNNSSTNICDPFSFAQFFLVKSYVLNYTVLKTAGNDIEDFNGLQDCIVENVAFN